MSVTALVAIISAAEAVHGIPSGLLTAVCTVESNLKPHIEVAQDGIGGRKSIGLCMVQERTARQFRPGISAAELYNPNTNAHVAGAYLRWQYQRYGSWDRAVVAFNRGSSTGPSNGYSRKVMRAYKLLLAARTSDGHVYSDKGRPNTRRGLSSKGGRLHDPKPRALGDRRVLHTPRKDALLESNKESAGGLSGRNQGNQVRSDRGNSGRKSYATTSGDFLREDLAYTD